MERTTAQDYVDGAYEKMNESLKGMVGKFFQDSKGHIYLYEYTEDNKHSFIDFTEAQTSFTRRRFPELSDLTEISAEEAIKVNSQISKSITDWFNVEWDSEHFDRPKLHIPAKLNEELTKLT